MTGGEGFEKRKQRTTTHGLVGIRGLGLYQH